MALIADGHLIVVDCGTGLLTLYQELFENKQLFDGADIFLTHVHWDHIQALAFFPPVFSDQYHFSIYGEKRLGKVLSEQIDGAFCPPIFPVHINALGYHEINCGDCLNVGNGVEVRTTRLTHPDICTGYRFTYHGKSVCVVSDYEHGGDEPLEFARDADVLIYDGQYMPEEYEKKRGWGHSTWVAGCDFARRCSAKMLLLTHHDPMHTDVKLAKMQEAVTKEMPGALLVWDGMRIALE